MQRHPQRQIQNPQYCITDERCKVQVFRQQPNQFLRGRGVAGLFFTSDSRLLLSRRNGEVSAVRLTNAIKENGLLQFEIVWDRDYQLNVLKQSEGYIFDITMEELPQVMMKGGKVIIKLYQFKVPGSWWSMGWQVTYL